MSNRKFSRGDKGMVAFAILWFFGVLFAAVFWSVVIWGIIALVQWVTSK